MKKIAQIENPQTGIICKVYGDSEWQEYRVKIWRHGQYQVNADHHDDDKQSAFDTAHYLAQRG